MYCVSGIFVEHNSIAVEKIVINNASNDGSVAQITQSVTQKGSKKQ